MTTEELKIKEALEEKFVGVQTELQELRDKGQDSSSRVEKLTEAIKEQGSALQSFMEMQKAAENKTFEDEFGEFLVENKGEIERIAKARSGEIEFVPKVVGDMSTGSGGDGAVTPPANHNTSLSNIRYRNDNWVIDACNSFSTNSASFAYTEVSPKEGGYAFVAEGGTKPQIDFQWQNRYAEPYKIAAYEIFTEESVTDIARLQSVGTDFLRKRHDLFKADALLFADGTGNNATGATVLARTFAAGGMADKIPINTTNFMDVVNAMIVDMYTTHNYADETNYSPNIVLVNPVDFFLQLVAAKDANGLPLYPQASLFNTVNMGGVPIRPYEKVPAGKIFVADMSKYNITNYVPYSVRLGWINDQFITNKFTMVGESRFHAFVRNFDQQAFIYDDIATVLAAIEANV